MYEGLQSLKTPKSNCLRQSPMVWAEVRWSRQNQMDGLRQSPMVFVLIRTPKSNDYGITPSVTSRHDDLIDNVKLAIQHQQNGSDRLSGRSIHERF